MNTLPSSIGTCPSCRAAIPPLCLLIEYERHNEPAAYAECPQCRSVVRPIRSEAT